MAHAVGLAPGSVLTPQALALGRRRLEDLPAASASRVDYTPVGRGQTELRAAVVEPSLVPSGWFDAGGVALGAAINRELAWTFTSPTGNGEAIAAQWRWWENRPRVSLSAAIPVRPGILTIDGFVERQTFSTTDSSQAVVVDDRRSVSAGLHNWATPWLRWNAGVGADRWNGLGTLPRVTGSLDVRAAADRRRAWCGDDGLARSERLRVDAGRRPLALQRRADRRGHQRGRRRRCRHQTCASRSLAWRRHGSGDIDDAQSAHVSHPRRHRQRGVRPATRARHRRVAVAIEASLDRAHSRRGLRRRRARVAG